MVVAFTTCFGEEEEERKGEEKGKLIFNRNKWYPMVKYCDNFAQDAPPEPWALEFRQSLEDVITHSSGPDLRRGITRLMKHPQYRDAHGTVSPARKKTCSIADDTCPKG